METLKNEYEIEIIGSEIINSNGFLQNNNRRNHKANQLIKNQEHNGERKEKHLISKDDDDDEDFLVIELVDENEETEKIEEDNEEYVDINLENSPQLLVYLAKKPRLYIRCHDKAVTQAVLFKRYCSRNLVFLKPCYRISIKKTENWYYNYCHTVYLRPKRRYVKRKPVHYTEKVECRDGIEDIERDASKGSRDTPGFEIKFVNESNNEVSKLTLSADFTRSYEEKMANVKEVEKDINITEDEKDEPGLLRRSYSIEFLNENDEKSSISAEQIASRIEHGEGHQIYDDYDEESQYSIDSSLDNQGSKLKRSYSIEFLNEKEDDTQAFSSEVISYQINKGQGVLVYSDVQNSSTTTSITVDECEQNNGEDAEMNALKRSYSIEFLDDSQDKRSPFSYETISNKIEKGEGRLIYVDPEFVSNATPKKKVRTPSQKLKTLGVDMHTDKDDNESQPISKHNKAYSIEFLNERDNLIPTYADYDDDDDYDHDYIEDDVISSEEQSHGYVEDEVSRELKPRIVDIDIDDDDEEDDDEEASMQEKRAYSIEFLDEEDDMAPIFEDNQTSTPTKTYKRPHSPKKSPLQTISIDWEFEKRNRLEQGEEEIFINDKDDYLLYEDEIMGRGKNESVNGLTDISRGKLETIIVDMETHHKIKIPTDKEKRDFQLEFQTEQERRLSMMQVSGIRTARIPSESSAHLRTVSVETDAEEIIEETEPLQQSPTLMKRKFYSVELLNEFDGDKSVFAEEIDDDGKWILNV